MEKQLVWGAEIIYVFISLGMPHQLVCSYLEEAKNKREIQVVLRGITSEGLRETIKKLAQCGSELPRIIIDPLLFQRFSIQQVPAVVAVGANGFNKITGSVSIDYALKTFARGFVDVP
jgi:type-F conjugative transfer system pilin assembly protein TrbC